jgi:hypothetical protein
MCSSCHVGQIGGVPFMAYGWCILVVDGAVLWMIKRLHGRVIVNLLIEQKARSREGQRKGSSSKVYHDHDDDDQTVTHHDDDEDDEDDADVGISRHRQPPHRAEGAIPRGAAQGILLQGTVWH